MSDGTKIAWTEATCSVYDGGHGTDTRRRFEERCCTARDVPGGVLREVSCGSKVVLQMQALATYRGLRHRSLPWRWVGSVLPGLDKPRCPRVLSTSAPPADRSLIRTCAGRRCKTSAEARELLRRSRLAANSELSSLCGLRAHLGGRRRPTRIRPSSWIRSDSSRGCGSRLRELPSQSVSPTWRGSVGQA